MRRWQDERRAQVAPTCLSSSACALTSTSLSKSMHRSSPSTTHMLSKPRREELGDAGMGGGVRIDQHVVEQVDAPLLTVHHAHAVEDPQGGALRRGDGRGAAAHQAARRTGPGDVRVCGAATGTGIISARRPWPCGRTRIRNDLRWRVQTGMV